MAPNDLSVSSDEWFQRSDHISFSILGARKIVDDVLVSVPTLQELNLRIRKILECCSKENIVISLKKFQIGLEVKFDRHIISSKGLVPDLERLKAITKYLPPSCTEDVKLPCFHPNLSHMTANLRQLRKKGMAFQWLQEH